MANRPKILLGLAIFFIVLFILFSKIIPGSISPVSTFEIAAQKNQFDFSFKLTKSDQPQFQKALEALQLPSSIQQGASFELDSTSSAKLAYVAPIKGQFLFSKKAVDFIGSTKRTAVAKNLSFQSFPLPPNLNFAISSTDLTLMAQTHLSLPQNLTDTIIKETSPGPQVIASFGQEPNIVYIFKTGNFDITSLKDMAESAEYKQETQDGVTLYILKNVTAFELKDFSYITSGLDAAKAVIAVSQNKNHISFPTEKQGVISLLFINTDKNPVPQSLLLKMFNTEKKIPTFLKNISRLSFDLEDKSFTGSIETK